MGISVAGDVHTSTGHVHRWPKKSVKTRRHPHVPRRAHHDPGFLDRSLVHHPLRLDLGKLSIRDDAIEALEVASQQEQIDVVVFSWRRQPRDLLRPPSKQTDVEPVRPHGIDNTTHEAEVVYDLIHGTSRLPRWPGLQDGRRSPTSSARVTGFDPAISA